MTIGAALMQGLAVIVLATLATADWSDEEVDWSSPVVDWSPTDVDQSSRGARYQRRPISAAIVLLPTKRGATGGAASDDEGGDVCEVRRNPLKHAFFDRICEMCHDMFAHLDPNIRSSCRANCFNNRHFKKCASQFTTGIAYPKPPMRRRQRSRRDSYY